MRKNRFFIFLYFVAMLLVSNIAIGQVVTNTEALMKFSKEKAVEFNERRAIAEKYAVENNIPMSFVNDKGIFFELQYIDERGVPMYYKTDNSNAAKTVSTNKVYTGGGAGLDLDGTGITPREWDGGGVRLGHQEFGGRVTQGDSPSSTNWHSTHVAGTIMAAGVQASAKGMAYNANLRAFDWDSDNSEMASEAANGALVSNHSYGFGRGWSWTNSGWTWYGTPSVSTQEDYKFGFYDYEARGWDIIARNAPYYLIVKSAGNDRNEGPNGGEYPKDGPYDCIAHGGISKNVLTVGAVNDIPGGYVHPGSVSMSSFSAWGPADDGRVKPDIVANGVGLYSCDDSGNSSYTSSDGTSMSAPSATGSLVLLQEHWENLVGNGEYMTAATLKGLVIHTADEAGSNDGPDYQYGWGLMNTKNAALKISEDQDVNVIDEIILTEGGSYEMVLVSDGTEDLKVTICWTDAPGQPVSAQLDPLDPMLVNDLDLRVTLADETFFPWKLDRDAPQFMASNDSENDVDNVEVVYIKNPVAGEYTVIVDHDGSITEGAQAFSIIIGGVTNTISLPTVLAGDDMGVCENSTIELSGQATNYNSITWSTTGDGTFDDSLVLNAVYTPGLGDIEVGSVELELLVEAIPPATGSVSDNLTITITSAPTSDAGEDINICNNTTAQLAGIASSYESVTWNTEGDGEFSDSNLLEAIYTPGVGDISAGQVVLNLVANAVDPCTEGSIDNLTVNIGVVPVANAGMDEITCGNMPFQLEGTTQDNDGVEWTTSGDGVFNDVSVLNPVYTPGSSDLTLGMVDLHLTALAIAPCGTNSEDVMVLEIESMPDISAGDDATACANSPVTVTGVVDNPLSVSWSTLGDGSFTDNTALITDYIPGTMDMADGSVNLVFTAYFTEGCEMGFDELTLEIIPAATSYAGLNDSVCKDGAYTLAGETEYSSSTQWSTMGDGSFTNASILNTDYTPGSGDISNGSVELKLTASPEAPCSEDIISSMVLSVLDCDAIGENLANRLGFILVPNPAVDQFIISTQESIDDQVRVRIISLNGSTMYNKEFDVNGKMFSTSISTASFPNGIYSVIVSSKSKAGVSRLVIQH